MLVDPVAHGQGMVLIGAEDDGFFQRTDVVENGLGNQVGALVDDDLSIVIVGFVNVLG